MCRQARAAWAQQRAGPFAASKPSQGRAWGPRSPWRAGRAAPVGGEHDHAPSPVAPDDLPGESAGRAPPGHGSRHREPPEGHAPHARRRHQSRVTRSAPADVQSQRTRRTLWYSSRDAGGPAPPRVGVCAGGGLGNRVKAGGRTAASRGPCQRWARPGTRRSARPGTRAPRSACAAARPTARPRARPASRPGLPRAGQARLGRNPASQRCTPRSDASRLQVSRPQAPRP